MDARECHLVRPLRIALTHRLHGALHVPSDGIAKGGNICRALQEGAEARGATFVATVGIGRPYNRSSIALMKACGSPASWRNRASP